MTAEEATTRELNSGAGNDTYRYATADGQVRIEMDAEGASTGDADRVVFTDLTLAEVEFSTGWDWTVEMGEDGSYELIEHEALVIEWSRGGESGRLQIAGSGGHIERFEFSDGSSLSRIEVDVRRREPGRTRQRAYDRLVGTAESDVISSGAGRDWLDGGDGDDVLAGGEGNDIYEFSGRSFGRDRVTETGGRDAIEFSEGVSWDQLWFARSGDDLVISLMGTESEVAVEDWWNGPLVSDSNGTGQVETILAGDHSLDSDAVSRLVEAMAGMSAPASGQMELTAAQRHQMASPLAAWQDVAGS